jgi:hypothetical protein
MVRKGSEGYCGSMNDEKCFLLPTHKIQLAFRATLPCTLTSCLGYVNVPSAG